MPHNKKKSQYLDLSIFVPYILMCIIGLVTVFSTTSASLIEVGASPYADVSKQAFFVLLSIFFIYWIYRFKQKVLRNPTFVRVVVMVLAFVLVVTRFAFPAINGAHGWIRIPGMGTIQPAEFLKIIVVWFLAQIFADNQENIQTQGFEFVAPTHTYFLTKWRTWIFGMIGLVAIMPDLGNAIMIVGVSLVMVYASGVDKRYFKYDGLLMLVISGVLLWAVRFFVNVDLSKIPVLNLFTHITKRFVAYVNPFEDLSDSGHQIVNGYYAVVNGGWFGRGLGNSIEKRGYLPEAQTDFVFQIVVEEVGLIGAIIVLAILFYMIIRMYTVGIRAHDPFNSLIAIGIASVFLIQVFVNVGGVAGLIPSTGVTFPFLSQGGSSFLVLSLGVGLVLNVSATEERERDHRAMIRRT